jgi:hypothetical protein
MCGTGITEGSPPYQKRLGSTRRRLGGLGLGDAEPRVKVALTPAAANGHAMNVAALGPL